MKKIMSILMAIMMAVSLVCAATAEEDVEFPEPEGGKKFDSCWAFGGGSAEINYEEEGYRVYIEIYNQEDLKGTVWSYNCYYEEDKDALVSISSEKYTYQLDPETFDRIVNDSEYDDIDEEGQESVFTISEDGKLEWLDGRENAGVDLEFQDIGRFQGQFRNDAEEVWVEINWEGMDQECFYYTVFIHRGDDANFTEFNMTGMYNPETQKLECEGTATNWIDNQDGAFEPVEDPETYDAFFSITEDGKLLFEAANGIELENESFLDDIGG